MPVARLLSNRPHDQLSKPAGSPALPKKPKRPAKRRFGQILDRGKDRRTGLPRWQVRVYDGRISVAPLEAGGPSRTRQVYRCETVYGTLKDAELRLNKLVALYSDHRSRAARVEWRRRPLREFAEHWLANGCPTTRREKPGPRTRSGYETDLRRYVLPHLGDVRLAELTRARVQRWADGLRIGGGEHGGPLGPRTTEKAFAVLRAMLFMAVQWEALPTFPCKNIHLDRATREPRALIGEGELQRFLSVAENGAKGEAGTPDEPGDRYSALWRVLALCGLRPGEAMALKWSDLEGNLLHVRRAATVGPKGAYTLHRPKTRSSVRAIPLDPRTVLALKKWREWCQGPERARAKAAEIECCAEEFIFTDELGYPVHATYLRDRFQRLLRLAGLPKHFRVYDLRATCATLLLRRGIDARTVANRLGHASVAMTLNIYTASNLDMQAEASARMAEAAGLG